MTYTDADLAALTARRRPSPDLWAYEVTRADGDALNVWAANAVEARVIEREHRVRILGERPLQHGGVAMTRRSEEHFPGWCED